MNKEIYIWGAGRYGVLTALDLEQKAVKVTGFIDSNADKIKTRLGLPVLSPLSVIESKCVWANSERFGICLKFNIFRIF